MPNDFPDYRSSRQVPDCRTAPQRDVCEVGRPMKPWFGLRDWTWRHAWKDGICTQCLKTLKQVTEARKVRRPISLQSGAK